MIRKKLRLQILYRKEPINTLMSIGLVKRKVTKMIREARDAFFCNKQESDSSNLRSMWSTMNNIMSRNPSNELETSFCIDGHETNDELQTAKGFN